MAKKKRLTPAQITEKQINKVRNAKQDFINGVNAVDEAPGVTLASRPDSLSRMRTNWLDAFDSGFLVQRLEQQDLGKWKSKTSGKGADNWVDGIVRAQPEILAFQTAFTPIRRQVADEVRSMPNATFDDRMRRMVANATGLHANRYKARK